MQAQLQQRLRELRQEFQTGQMQLRELEQQEARLREILLRISGAIQVLEEELAKAGPAAQPAPEHTAVAPAIALASVGLPQ